MQASRDRVLTAKLDIPSKAAHLRTSVHSQIFVLQISFLYQKQPANEFWKAVEAISMIRLVRLGHILPDVQELLLVTVS